MPPELQVPSNEAVYFALSRQDSFGEAAKVDSSDSEEQDKMSPKFKSVESAALNFDDCLP